MLTDVNKVSALWKSFKGWGSTHTNREVFEELYRSYKDISVNSVLTYGDLLPRKSTDKFFEDIQRLDATNSILYYKESSFKQIPLVKKHIGLTLTPISSNCDHAFVILDENGEQIRNIIPFDYSDTGLYNYTLQTNAGVDISWGISDWLVDTNSSILTFNNGVPEGVTAEKPPKLTFYQYIGPVGERHYIDANLFDIDSVIFHEGQPVVDCTGQISNYLDNIETDFFKTYGFNGTDTTQGIGLQYNILSNAIETKTNDPIKGYDDNSNAQVVHLLSHLKGETTSAKVLFVSEGVEQKTYNIEIDESNNKHICKIDVENGFIVVQGPTGVHEVVVAEGDSVSAVLLVKDNETQDYELFYPRNELELTIKVPVFTDLIKLPPHLKLSSLSSFSDHITPQYYGPRVADFVIATGDTTTEWRSADFVVYNKDGFYLSDAIDHHTGSHIFLRNGVYENGNNVLNFPSEIYIQGESRNKTIIRNTTLILENDSIIEKIRFENCEVSIKNIITFKSCDFVNTKVYVENNNLPATIKSCTFEDLEVDGNTQIFSSQIQRLKIVGTANIFESAIIETVANTGTLSVYSSFINSFKHTAGRFYIHSSRIVNLDCTDSETDSILDSTAIDYVENLPEFIKIDSSYVTKFSDNIKREVYPDERTIPYYVNFEKRVYTKLPDPFLYKEDTNELTLKLDTIEYTIFINEKGELQCRFFSSKEIYLENPDNLKTQIEAVYQEHADTRLGTKKPQNVEEALVDLYWSKADLKNGKVPIDQLPDSVAYGGLQCVGMWSFEDSSGEYPTFEDCDLSFSSDDEYTGLQNGWFFIISASHKEDDPVYPQTSNNGVEWTAGDWCIYTGGKKRVIDYSKPLDFSYKNSQAVVYTNDDKSITYAFGLKDGSYEDSYEGSYEDDDIVTLTVDFDGKIIDFSSNFNGAEIGDSLRNIKGFKLLEAQYKNYSAGDSWQKLDRAYLDPVYSRLPELAVVTGDENIQWSIRDGGTGLLRLSFKSLAEAIRLINEQLFKSTPDRPTSIQLINVMVDEDRTTAKLREYISIDNGNVLSQVVQKTPSKVYDSDSGIVYFKQSGVHDYLPLEHCFYSGKSSVIKVKDSSSDITDNCEIQRFDPYEKYRLGFRAPSEMDAAEITGFVQLGKGTYRLTHSVNISQYNLEKSPLVMDDVSKLEGESGSCTFTEQRFYKFDDYHIYDCESDTVNLRVLNNLLKTHRTGGYGYLPTGTKVEGSFVIENFTKYGILTPDAKVEVFGTFNGEDIETVIDSQNLILTDQAEEIYDLRVSFTVILPEDVDYTVGKLIVKTTAQNFGIISTTKTVLKLENLVLIKPESIPGIVESASMLMSPVFGTTDNTTQFGGDYQIKTADFVKNYPELVFTDEGFGWPKLEKYINHFADLNTITMAEPDTEKGVLINKNLYRFITFKRSFEIIHDLCGFNVNLEWSEIKPTLSNTTGLYDDITLQVCVRSDELDSVQLMNGNKVVPVFFESDLKVDTPCNHPGKSTVDTRRITFGRKPLPIQDIYIRVGIPKNSGIYLKNVNIELSE